MARAALYNLELVVKGNYKLFDKTNARKTYQLLRTKLGLSPYGASEVLLALGMHTEFWPNKLHRLNKAIKSLLHLPDATSRL
ncbi:MAG: hypothetical protein EOO60_06745 [Hymenobacter sp.]|nr:MAG: hypothetical protein EOO60_06745 [Hymenobacter sp.]